ncbi:kinase-like protein [Coprinopsis marcescibilis]|uniref:Kinase-like protein n=1 Tax=Coprinopsis marcescibilis TaxID=230819 RepID=A0A5C3K9M9_COPMA|nr:kinase-like protein [Coprinopsis marcescibilis]
MMWANALLLASYSLVDEVLESRNGQPPPFTIPRLRFVKAALATSMTRASIRGKSTASAPAVGRTYLIEERLEGSFKKYIHNAGGQPSASILPDDEPYYTNARFLSFTQHAQFELTSGLAFVSDYQGNGDLLTDPQILTSPTDFDSAALFGDGNLSAGFSNFPKTHECNDYCTYFDLPPFF